MFKPNYYWSSNDGPNATGYEVHLDNDKVNNRDLSNKYAVIGVYEF